jgi:hypothetical protein
MRIIIEWIDTELTTQGNDIGYLIRFYSKLVSGTALLAATHSVTPAMRGQEISVELEQQAIQDAVQLSPTEIQVPCLIALPAVGNFIAVGEVANVTLQENGSFLVDVYVDDGLFTWITCDPKQGTFRSGDWLRFTIIGLAFWDIEL